MSHASRSTDRAHIDRLLADLEADYAATFVADVRIALEAAVQTLPRDGRRQAKADWARLLGQTVADVEARWRNAVIDRPAVISSKPIDVWRP